MVCAAGRSGVGEKQAETIETGSREGEREGGREGGRKEGRQDRRRERGSEARWERGMNGGREGGREGRREEEKASPVREMSRLLITHFASSVHFEIGQWSEHGRHRVLVGENKFIDFLKDQLHACGEDFPVILGGLFGGGRE